MDRLALDNYNQSVRAPEGIKIAIKIVPIPGIGRLEYFIIDLLFRIICTSNLLLVDRFEIALRIRLNGRREQRKAADNRQD
jgi:hypothetical protein